MIFLNNNKIFTFFFFFLLQTTVNAQQAHTFQFPITDSCHWDKVGTKTKKTLTNKTGLICSRFGTTIINIKGRVYNPCNLPANMEGKKVMVSAVLYKNAGSDGTPVRLTYLEILTN